MRLSARCALILVILALSDPVTAAGQTLCVPRIADPPIQFEYVIHLVDSFKYAKAASDQTEQAIAKLAATQVNSQAEFVAAITDVLVAVKGAGLDYQCAASLVEPFTKSANDAIKSSAEGAHLVYTQLAAIDREMFQDFLQGLNTPGRSPGAEADRLSDLTVKKRQVWKFLTVATAAATHAIVVLPDNAQERLSRLNLTAAQRQTILSELEKTFGVSIRGGGKAGQSALQFSAATLHGFVSNRSWKSLDAP